MILPIQFALKQNQDYKRYLRTHSEWYKELNRNASSFSLFEKEVKDTYHLYISDRIEKTLNTIDFITALMSTLK